MATLEALSPFPAEIEERIEAFERAWDRESPADLSGYLPPTDHPAYRAVLAELIRIEMEFLWGRGTPRPIEVYLIRFPVLRSDRELLAAVAYEEFRQRRQAGQSASPHDYVQRCGLDLADWPVTVIEPEADELRTNALAVDELVHATAPPPSCSWGPAPRREPAKSKPPEIGDVVLNRFRIKERLGKGAFGSVFLAERLDLFDRPAALKFLPAPSIEPEMLARLIHENIVPIESADRHGSMLVICMPYRGKTTLQHILDSLPRESLGGSTTGKLFVSTLQERSGSKSGNSDSSSGSRRGLATDPNIDPQFRSLSQLEKLSGMSHVEATLRIAMGIAAGLAHAHERNIIHRDLKPANVLLADDGTPMLLDFNLATQIRKERPINYFRMGGTFPYMAPEQIQAARDKTECRDPRSDLYSLGVVLFELLTGRHPFPKVNRVSDDFLDKLLAARRAPQADPCQFNPAVSRSVADIVHKLLAHDVANRYQHARDVKEDIERHLANLPLRHARESSYRARFAKFRRRHPRLTTSLAACLFLLLPAAILTAVRSYSAYRLGQTQRAEAVVMRDRSLQSCYEIQTLAHARHNDSRLFTLGQRRAEELVQRYGVDPGAPWDSRPEVSRLSDAERMELLDGLGETFMVLAVATEQHAQDTGNNPLKVQSKRWRELAANCLGKAGRDGTRGKAPALGKDARALPELAPLDNSELYRLAADLIADSRHRLALKVLDELTQRDPRQFMAWYRKAHCLDALGSNAVAAWETCVALQPELASCHHHLGLACLRARDYARAERAFTETYRLDPTMLNALIHRSISRKHQRKYEDADRDLSDVLADNPESVVALLFRSEVRRKMNKPTEADADFVAGMNKQATDEWSLSTRGYVRVVRNPKDKEALIDLDRALDVNPRHRESLNNRMYALEMLGRREDAIAAASLYISYYPDAVKMYADRGILAARHGKVEDALRDAEHCELLEKTSPNAGLCYLLGSLYAILSQHNPAHRGKALDLLNRSLVRGMDRPELFSSDTDLKPLHGNKEFEKLRETADGLARARQADRAQK